jgi:CheY-like chemotaxis protein/HD-like signal output (HDOD) protein
MKTILVVDDMAVFREPIAFCLRGQGYTAVCAGNGVEALGLLMTKPVDLILLDIGMPVMDGLTFLKAMSSDPNLPKPPVILLTAVAEKDYVIQAAKFGVRDYLLKSRFSLKDLLARVGERLAHPKAHADAPANASTDAGAKPPADPVAAPKAPTIDTPAGETSAHAPAPTPTGGGLDVPRLLTGDKCLLRTQSAMAKMKLSGVASKLIALATSSGGGPAELVSLVNRDRTLSGIIVEATNKVLAAPGKEVTALASAVDVFGYSAIRDLATTLAIFDTMPPTANGWKETSPWWEHSLAVAALCKRLLNSGHPGTEAAAYLAGLCHDVGEMLLRSHFTDEYRQVLEVHARTGKNRDELERAMLGITRGQLTQMILQDIGLPDAVRRSIALFYGETTGTRAAANEPLARALRMADAYACGLGLTPPEGSAICSFTRAHSRNATGDENPPAPDAAAFAERISRTISQLTDTPFKTPVLPGEAALRPKVWLARDPMLSSFDPIAAGLGPICDLAIRDRLPEVSPPAPADGSPAPANEVADLKGVVIAARNTTTSGFTSADVFKLLNSAGNTALPILWLTERNDAGTGSDAGPQPVVWPVTLERLKRFVQESAGKPEKAPTPVAA